ncbi:hypothetical protein DENSPDRAFT_582347 [Dentipellis sp. KUC8613]|nr:hypothetical protein DENSPDRAFT_582347 [Dentipellis sp. KUC8613]
MPTPCHLHPLGASNTFALPRNRRVRLSSGAARACHTCAPLSRMLVPTPSLSRAATSHSHAPPLHRRSTPARGRFALACPRRPVLRIRCPYAAVSHDPAGLAYLHAAPSPLLHTRTRHATLVRLGVCDAASLAPAALVHPHRPRTSMCRPCAAVPRPRVAILRLYAAVSRPRACDAASHASAALARPRRPCISMRCPSTTVSRAAPLPSRASASAIARHLAGPRRPPTPHCRPLVPALPSHPHALTTGWGLTTPSRTPHAPPVMPSLHSRAVMTTFRAAAPPCCASAKPVCHSRPVGCCARKPMLPSRTPGLTR